ncbi:LysR family transcriptional regulator [Variovorax terrae]|uniref:LysR family transcriptional regulator n=1 Tax=Variovorax terrae TaxID=2923278 RepID=A0A9X1W4W6_9BURK|nr:LysR family transcriptional regulator [Variovorax terrae]MCJ0765758.1 LysR family transcriptional regulator [Variovorax terrae]
MNINLKQLKAFLAVYQTRKFGSASERLFLTHSAVSVLIRQLESEVGQRLFDRTTRTLRPTAAANDLYPIAERVLRELGSINEHFKSFSSGAQGRLTFAVTPVIAVNLAPKAIRAFSELHPGVQVIVEDCAPAQFAERLLSDQVEFGIGTPEQITSEIECETLIKGYLCAVMRVTDPLARDELVRWVELKGQPVIAVKPGYGIRHSIDAAVSESGANIRFAHEVSYLMTALAFAAEGMGIAILPSSLVSQVKYPQVVARRLVAPTVTRDVCIMTKRGATLSPAADAFLALMRAGLSDGRIPLTPAF